MSELNYRKYGQEPYSVVVVHGGPGAPGGMAYVAKILAEERGVIEPFQTSRTVRGQIEELHSVINENCKLPVVIIGHSWGAWLAFMLAAQFPNDVSKLILVGAGPFVRRSPFGEESTDVTETRLRRLDDHEQTEARSIIDLINNSSQGRADAQTFRRFGELMSKADLFDPIEIQDEAFDFQPEIYWSIWPEAERLRNNGTLIEFGKEIHCPVIAIHGDYDPHPMEGVREPLQRTLKDFKFVLLKDCGHYPWKEKKAGRKFFPVLSRELRTK